MATTYYQPGVYIQEIDSPQVSIQSAPTAVPAFIGYTAMAQEIAPNDLLCVPFEINSLLEYVQYFGAGPGPFVSTVSLDGNNNFISADVEIQYKMYDAVRMFYLNGGGTAYIVSVGLYTANGFSPKVSDFLPNPPTPTVPGPFVPLARLQEPTLMVFPDNALFMDQNGSQAWSGIYTEALQQCATVQSTFLIGDFYYNATVNNSNTSLPPLENLYAYETGGLYTYNGEVTAFRQAIGMDNLNYGAIYGPWVDILPSNPITYATLYNDTTTIYVAGAQVSNLSSLAVPGSTVQQTALNVEQLLDDINTVNTGTTGIVTAVDTYDSHLAVVQPDLGSLYAYIKSLIAQGKITADQGIQDIYKLLFEIGSTVEGYLGVTTGTGTLTSSSLQGYIASTSTPVGLIAQTNGLRTLLYQLAQVENSIVKNQPLSTSESTATFTVGAGDTFTATSYPATATSGTVTISYGTGTPVPIASASITTNIAGTANAVLANLTSAAFTTILLPGWTVNYVPGTGTFTIEAPLSAGSLGSQNITLTLTAGSYTGTSSADPYTASFGTYSGYVAQLAGSITTGINGAWTITGTTTPFNDTTTIAAAPIWQLPTTGNSGPPNNTPNVQTNLSSLLLTIDPLIAQVITQYSSILPWAQSTEAALEVQLLSSFPAFANIIHGVNSTPIPFPPSGAMAGVYANVDNTLGVWKAPANLSINGIIGPNWTFDSANYDDLNVDLTAGKSINAIRTFTGLGTLVWGARTLQGNSTLWRYISVRRFFIMVEQAVKLALQTYVFEPNAPITWTTVIAEVNAYLYSLWRAGALMGSKPSEAYIVQCGLGTTMTNDDILNGRMIVKIGMAVVRPAEFIILQFTQNVQSPSGN